jgi:hypothetical protein
MRPLALAFAMVLSSSAQAETVTSSFFALTQLGTNDGVQFSQQLHLFDSDLGVLTSATLVLDASSAVRFVVEAHSLFVVGGASMEATLSMTSSIPALGALLDTSLIMELAPQNYPAASIGILVGPFTDSDSATHTFSLPADLGALQSPGGGTFDVSCGWNTEFAILTGTIQVLLYDLAAKCAGSIEYTYATAQTVPEPAPLPLIGLAGLGLFVTARRTQRASLPAWPSPTAPAPQRA